RILPVLYRDHLRGRTHHTPQAFLQRGAQRRSVRWDDFALQRKHRSHYTSARTEKGGGHRGPDKLEIKSRPIGRGYACNSSRRRGSTRVAKSPKPAASRSSPSMAARRAVNKSLG